MQASVVIPTRNRPTALARILGKFILEIDRYALADRVEIVVVDDACEPPVTALLREDYQRHASLKIVRQQIHGGCSAARNAGRLGIPA